MATTIKIETKSQAHLEVSGVSEGIVTTGTHTRQIGAIGAVVSFLTISDFTGKVKITASTGAVNVSIDGNKDKLVKKGGSIVLPQNAKRAVVRERVR